MYNNQPFHYRNNSFLNEDKLEQRQIERQKKIEYGNALKAQIEENRIRREKEKKLKLQQDINYNNYNTHKYNKNRNASPTNVITPYHHKHRNVYYDNNNNFSNQNEYQNNIRYIPYNNQQQLHMHSQLPNTTQLLHNNQPIDIYEQFNSMENKFKHFVQVQIDVINKYEKALDNVLSCSQRNNNCYSNGNRNYYGLRNNISDDKRMDCFITSTCDLEYQRAITQIRFEQDKLKRALGFFPLEENYNRKIEELFNKILEKKISLYQPQDIPFKSKQHQFMPSYMMDYKSKYEALKQTVPGFDDLDQESKRSLIGFSKLVEIEDEGGNGNSNSNGENNFLTTWRDRKERECKLSINNHQEITLSGGDNRKEDKIGDIVSSMVVEKSSESHVDKHNNNNNDDEDDYEEEQNNMNNDDDDDDDNHAEEGESYENEQQHNNNNNIKQIQNYSSVLDVNNMHQHNNKSNSSFKDDINISNTNELKQTSDNNDKKCSPNKDDTEEEIQEIIEPELSSHRNDININTNNTNQLIKLHLSEKKQPISKSLSIKSQLNIPLNTPNIPISNQTFPKRNNIISTPSNSRKPFTDNIKHFSDLEENKEKNLDEPLITDNYPFKSKTNKNLDIPQMYPQHKSSLSHNLTPCNKNINNNNNINYSNSYQISDNDSIIKDLERFRQIALNDISHIDIPVRKVSSNNNHTYYQQQQQQVIHQEDKSSNGIELIPKEVIQNYDKVITSGTRGQININNNNNSN